MSEDRFKNPTVFERRPMLLSLGAAAAAWIAIPLALYVRGGPDDRAAVPIAMAAWPVGYAMVLGLAWVIGYLAASADESNLMGPNKPAQLRVMRATGRTSVNAAIVLFPSAVFLVSFLVLIGVLKPQ